MPQSRPVGGPADGPEQGIPTARVELASLLRQWRKEAGDPVQATVAKGTNTTQGTLSRYENGKQDASEPAIRALGEYYNRAAQDIARALELRTQVEAEQPGGTPASDAAIGSKAVRDRKNRRPLMTVAAVILLLAGGATIYKARPWAAMQTTAQPAPSASSGAPARVLAAPTTSCSSSSCVHVEPTTTVCQNDAITTAEGRDFGVHVELRYSPSCHAAWAKLTGSSPGDRIQVFGHEGSPPQQEEYRQQSGRTAHTQMVQSAGPNDAHACAVVDSRGTVCTSPLPSAAPNGSPSV